MPRDAAARPEELRVQPADFWRWVWASIRPQLGWVLAGAGFLMLLIGYFGVSREVLVAKQLPYLVSGGLIGLGLVTLGSRLMLIEDLRRDSGRLDRLERMVEDLSLALLSRPDSPVRTASRDTADSGVLDVAEPYVSEPVRRPAADAAVLVLRGGATFHRGGCSVVAGKRGDEVPASTARARGLRACRLCQPLAVVPA